MRISDWSSDVCSSDLLVTPPEQRGIARQFIAERRVAVDAAFHPLQHRDETAARDRLDRLAVPRPTGQRHAGKIGERRHDIGDMRETVADDAGAYLRIARPGDD